jgi:hypothetical protein
MGKSSYLALPASKVPALHQRRVVTLVTQFLFVPGLDVTDNFSVYGVFSNRL